MVSLWSSIGLGSSLRSVVAWTVLAVELAAEPAVLGRELLVAVEGRELVVFDIMPAAAPDERGREVFVAVEGRDPVGFCPAWNSNGFLEDEEAEAEGSCPEANMN